MHPDVGAPVPSEVIYVAGSKLWHTTVDGGPKTQIKTPWPLAAGVSDYQEVLWSPDRRRVALDDRQGRLAVINLATTQITILLNRRCSPNICYSFDYAWSPNGRYLAFIRPQPGNYGTLMLWDSTSGGARPRLGKISGYASTIDWSHDGTRLLVNTGPFDLIKSIFPSATVVPLSGTAHVLTKGLGNGWSPDDRFVGIVRSHFCGANTCDDAELVVPSGGGSPVTLTQHIQSTFEDPEWAQSAAAGGVTYGFDRWALGPLGHMIRRLAGPNERVDGWAPDGAHLAIETYHPYEETPDALYISTTGGARVHLYTAGRKNSCGACSKGTYQVVWSQCGTGLVGFSTPTYPTPKTLKPVYSKLYLAHVTGGVPTRIHVRGTDATLVGFADHDSELIVLSGGTLYGYVVSASGLNVIARGVTALALPPLAPLSCA